MKAILTIFLLAVALTGYAQEYSDTVINATPMVWTDRASDYAAIEGHYGVMMFRSKALGNYLGTHINQPINKAGISLSGRLEISRRYVADGHLSFDYMLPIKQTVSDTHSFEFSGFQWGIMVFGADVLHRNRVLDCIFGVGFNSGTYWLDVDENGIKGDFRNPFFAPKGVGELRVIMGRRVTLGSRIEYQLDVSSRRWKVKTGSGVDGSRFSGMSLQVLLGVAF